VQNKQNSAVPLGHHHARGVVLPFAVSESGGPATMHISHTAGCSSLLRANEDTTWGKFCLDLLENRTVDTISVDELARLLPEALPIRLLKIDVQGLDVRLVRRMPRALLRRVRELRFEVALQNARCTSLYKGQETCESVRSYLLGLGFRGHCPRSPPYTGCEGDAVFRRAELRA